MLPEWKIFLKKEFVGYKKHTFVIETDPLELIEGIIEDIQTIYSDGTTFKKGMLVDGNPKEGDLIWFRDAIIKHDEERQWTTRVDMNGQKIYEGDRVNLGDHWEWIAEWKNSRWDLKRDFHHGYPLDFFRDSEMELIEEEFEGANE